MLKIRLTRVGKKKHPEYRVVVIPKENAAQGLYIERLGHYNPHTKQLTLDKEKISVWLSKGARPTNSVAKLFKKEGVELPKWVEIETKNKKPKAAKKEEAPKIEQPKEEAKVEETKAEEPVEAQTEVKE